MTQNWNRSLVDKFLSLRCAGDVLESLQPLNGETSRKITEAMALIDVVRPLILRHKGEYKLVEVCAGEPVTAVIAAHLLPVEMAKAILWRDEPKATLDRVHHFKCEVETQYNLKDKVMAEVNSGGKYVVAARNVRQEILDDLMPELVRNKTPFATIGGPNRSVVFGFDLR